MIGIITQFKPHILKNVNTARDSACFMGELQNRNGCYLGDTYPDTAGFVFFSLQNPKKNIITSSISGALLVPMGWDTIQSIQKAWNMSVYTDFKLFTKNEFVYTGYFLYGNSTYYPVVTTTFQNIIRVGHYRLRVHFGLDDNYDQLIFLQEHGFLIIFQSFLMNLQKQNSPVILADS